MTLFDLFVLLVMASSVVFGAAQGLLRETITLVALAGGVAAVALLSGPIGGIFGDGLVAVIAVLVFLFASGFALIQIALTFLLRRALGPRPHRPDRILGGLFGAVRGWFIVSLTFLAATFYFEAAALPDTLSKAWTRSFAASGARALDAIEIEGRNAAESEEETG